MLCTEPCLIAALDKSPWYEIIYNAPHTGRAFDTYNKEFKSILDELILVTDAADLIKTYRRCYDGRSDWITLCEHFDGPAEGDKRVTASHANINEEFYKN